jgi:hypothetical protein
VCELAIALQILVVTFCKCSINPITSPKSACNHSITWQYVSTINKDRHYAFTTLIITTLHIHIASVTLIKHPSGNFVSPGSTVLNNTAMTDFILHYTQYIYVLQTLNRSCAKFNRYLVLMILKFFFCCCDSFWPNDAKFCVCIYIYTL